MTDHRLRITDNGPRITDYRIVCLAGGVGGAKLAAGLAQIVPPANLTIIVNTGDDFQHLGLTVCPDLDTVMYTLAGVANPETGWGREGESWRTIEAVAQLGGPDWFRLGDLDLATHLTRTHLLGEGQTQQPLTAVTRHLCTHLHIQPTILPMSDQPAPTMIATVDGRVLPFQTWFVRERWQPPVSKIILPDDVKATHAVVRALETADIVIIAPSNPFVSIDPILNVYPIRALLEDVPQVVTAVSPIIGGQAVKGPAAKMMQEMGMAVSATAVAQYYDDLVDLFIYDRQDEGAFVGVGGTAVALDTMMLDADGRERVAREVLQSSLDYLSA
ncbi:MAG TPA: 2-phospho-L-lactate transferase [Chloroflexota bacterium]|nr:2-phospho-L-lactate transferase [Chloroflexota bacterium]